MEVNLRERIHSDLLSAMRAKDEALTSVLRMAIAAFEKRGIEKRSSGAENILSAEEEISVLRSEVKRRRESKDIFEKGGRQDLAEKEDFEIKILSSYLPPELSKDEIFLAVKDAIASTNAKTQKDFGLVMKEAMKALKGKADGSLVSSVIREFLGS